MEKIKLYRSTALNPKCLYIITRICGARLIAVIGLKMTYFVGKCSWIAASRSLSDVEKYFSYVYVYVVCLFHLFYGLASYLLILDQLIQLLMH